jgi:hypothetical protein
MQTGFLARGDEEYPHYGAVLAHLWGPRAAGLPTSVVLPGPIGNTGVSIGHGQSAGYLGPRHEPFRLAATGRDTIASLTVDPARPSDRTALVAAVDLAQRAFDTSAKVRPADAHDEYATLFSPEAKRAFNLHAEPDDLRARYGGNTFGQSCLLARRLVEGGVRLVTVNMFDTVFNEVTWDCHADGGSLAVTLDDYRRTLCPMFDRAYTALLDDLAGRGLLDNTLVVAMGEFGRTPVMNPRGGRDHWPNVWSVLFAGGPVKGGQVIGASDKHGMEPADRPVHASEVAASIYYALGIDLKTRLPGADNRPMPLVNAGPVMELFGS